MSLSVQQLLSDARRLSSRLREHDSMADGVVAASHELLKGVEAMKEYQEDLDALNSVAHNRPRAQLVLGIQQENRHIRQLQHENKELRAALEESQNAVELIMSKYRQHVQFLVNTTKMDKNLLNYQRARVLQEKTDQICEMASVMQKSIQLDEATAAKDHEVRSRLVTENKGLREMLEISRRSGTSADPIVGPKMVSRECQTEKEELAADLPSSGNPFAGRLSSGGGGGGGTITTEGDGALGTGIGAIVGVGRLSAAAEPAREYGVSGDSLEDEGGEMSIPLPPSPLSRTSAISPSHARPLSSASSCGGASDTSSSSPTTSVIMAVSYSSSSASPAAATSTPNGLLEDETDAAPSLLAAAAAGSSSEEDDEVTFNTIKRGATAAASPQVVVKNQAEEGEEETKKLNGLGNGENGKEATNGRRGAARKNGGGKIRCNSQEEEDDGDGDEEISPSPSPSSVKPVLVNGETASAEDEKDQDSSSVAQRRLASNLACEEDGDRQVGKSRGGVAESDSSKIINIPEKTGTTATTTTESCNVGHGMEKNPEVETSS